MYEQTRLPGALVEFWGWQLQAACRGLDPATFFHPANERGPSRREREAAAKTICSGCPVIRTCLEWALYVREPYGVWGGLSALERDTVLHSVSATRPAFAVERRTPFGA